MSVDGDNLQSLGRLSTDTSANINEDITWTSENSEGSPRKHTESVFSNYRGSIDGGIMSAFNILKLGGGEEDKHNLAFSPLGPNSIFELTVASDSARIRLNRGLKSHVTVNGGTNTVYNLTKPSTKDIPQIQLVSLKNKVASGQLANDLVKSVSGDYRSFELSYKALTEDVLTKFSQNFLLTALSDSEEEVDIPAVFEDADFRLDDPRIFRQVMENSRILPDPDSHDETHLIHNTEVQEKLSHYLDTVEVQLIHEISKTSDSFFGTLGEIQVIKSQSKECIDQFHGIMAKLDAIEDGQAQCGLKILDLLDERKSVCHLESTVLQLEHILNCFVKASAFYNAGSNNECLNQIIVIENLIAGVEREDYQDEDTYELYPTFDYPVTDLTGLPALITIRRDLHVLKNECSKSYIANFVELLLKNLRSHYQSVSTKDTMNRIYASVDRSRTYSADAVNRTYMEVDPAMKEDLRNFIKNLAKSGHLTQAFAEYQDKIIGEVKAIIRTGLPTSRSDSLQSESNAESRASSYPSEGGNTMEPTTSVNGSLSENIKNLSPGEFNSMMKAIYASLAECLRRLTIHQKVLLDLSLTTLSPAASHTIDVMSLDITNAINKAIELTQVRLVKVLNVRLEQLGDLPVADYMFLFSVSSAYLLECEFINPGFVATGPGSSLNEWVKSHAGYFVHRFHLNSVKRLAGYCDKETWRECTNIEEINAHQGLMDEVLGYADFVDSDGKTGFNGSAWSRMLDFYESDDRVTDEQRSTTNAVPRLKIRQESYLVPQLILNVIEVVRDYVRISKIFSSRTVTVESNLLTYFKVMNSRISQAILNAGATRTAGLRHITTKHLALCIQTIEFTIAFLNSIQLIFKAQKFDFDQSQGLEELTFAKTIGNYKDHERDLFSKLISIMYDRTLNHCSVAIKIDWSQPLKHPQQCHPYMETLVKETTTVATVLAKYLREIECSHILLQIFDNYKKLLVNCFCTELPQFKEFVEKHSLLKDIDYFRVKLSELPGYGNSGQVIWENVNSLPTVEDAKMDEIMRNNIKGESKAASARASMEQTPERKLVERPRSTEPPRPVEPPNPADSVEEVLFVQEDETELEVSEEGPFVSEAIEKQDATDPEPAEVEEPAEAIEDSSEVKIPAEAVEEPETKGTD